MSKQKFNPARQNLFLFGPNLGKKKIGVVFDSSLNF